MLVGGVFISRLFCHLKPSAFDGTKEEAIRKHGGEMKDGILGRPTIVECLHIGVALHIGVEIGAQIGVERHGSFF
jgi:hypothetical protein